MWAYLVANWKTNLAALVTIVLSATQFTAAITAWENHQPANWREAIMSLVVAIGLFAAKDGTNHSTQAQVTQATADSQPK